MKKLLALGIILIVIIGGFSFFNSRNQATFSIDEQIRQLEEKLTNDPVYQDRNSQSYKEVQNQLCLLKARPEEQREQAIAAIKDFVGEPDITVEFSCEQFRKPEYMTASQVERYLTNNNEVIISTLTNHVIEVPVQKNWAYQKDGTRLFDSSTNLPRYSQADIQTLAANFISKHSPSIGSIDLDNLTLEVGKKGDGTAPTNYFLTWSAEPIKRTLPEPQQTCSKDLSPEVIQEYDANGTPCYTTYEENYTPQLSIAFSNEGRLISFSNSLETK
mgnify:CR=1 FL=1